jgi:hypothetical protein
MTAETFFREIRTPLRGLQLIVATLLVATAIYSGVVLLGVGIYPFDLALTTFRSTGLIVLLVVPLLVARSILPGRMIDRGLRQIAAGQWEGGERPRSTTDALIQRTGDVGRLWQLFTTQALAGTMLVVIAAIVSLTTYAFAPSAPPLALGTLFVVGISSHLHAIDALREP